MKQTPLLPYHHAATLPICGRYSEPIGYRICRPNGSGDWLLLLGLEGSGFCLAKQNRILIEPGSALMMGPGVPHDYGTEPGSGPWQFWWVHFLPRPDWQDCMDWPEVIHGIRKATLDPAALARVDQLFSEMGRHPARGERHRQALVMNQLERILLEIDMVQHAAEGMGLDERIRAVILTLQGRLGKELTVSDLADLAGLSSSRFSHLFQKEMGVSPMVYLERCRLDRARQLLLVSQASVAQIAAQVGFRHPFHFSRRFRQRFKMSPTEFRSSAAEGSSRES